MKKVLTFDVTSYIIYLTNEREVINMVYFRFDCDKKDFKGTEHKSVLYGDDAMTMADLNLKKDVLITII